MDRCLTCQHRYFDISHFAMSCSLLFGDLIESTTQCPLEKQTKEEQMKQEKLQKLQKVKDWLKSISTRKLVDLAGIGKKLDNVVLNIMIDRTGIFTISDLVVMDCQDGGMLARATAIARKSILDRDNEMLGKDISMGRARMCLFVKINNICDSEHKLEYREVFAG